MPGREEVARRAREVLLADLSRHPTIPELARACGTSPTVLKEAFREEFGMPVYQWARRRRMIAAARLFAQTDLPVADVARALGYANASKFARAFASCLRMSPTAFRERYRPRAGAGLPRS